MRGMFLDSLNKPETEDKVKRKILKHTDQQRTCGLKAVIIIKGKVKV